jgi:hypothetical protein
MAAASSNAAARLWPNTASVNARIAAPRFRLTACAIWPTARFITRAVAAGHRMGSSAVAPCKDLPTPAIHTPRVIALIAAIAVVAFVLRSADAQGALWLDEAWSALFAHEVGTPAGVFFAINHDNNHFANTLWLQATGWGAPPIVSRGLSILSGAATVFVGGIIGMRRGPATAFTTAILLAVSPILLVYGAEARGYAPMLLGLIASIAIVDRWLLVGHFRAAPYLLGLAVALGTLAHLTMIVGIAGMAGWSVARLRQRLSTAASIVETLQLMRWAIAAAITIVGLVAIVAVKHGGYRIGNVTPFSWSALADGLGSMIAYTLGYPGLPGPLVVVGATMLVIATLWRIPEIRDRAPFYAITILLFPAAVALFGTSNSGFARYFLIAALALLLLVADLIGIGWQKGGWRRAVAAVALSGFCLGSAAMDATIIHDRRSDPGEAVTAMAKRAASGTTAIIDNPRSYAVLASAAASSAYRLVITEDRCSGAPFLFVDENSSTPLPATLLRCRSKYRRIAGRRLNGLSGLTWQLYVKDVR